MDQKEKNQASQANQAKHPDQIRQNETTPKKSSCGTWCIVIAIVMVVILAAAGITGYYLLKRSWDKVKEMDEFVEENLPETTDTSDLVGEDGIADKDLIGSWDTGCLVPDPESAWAEQHQFEIRSDGTATHQRLSGDSCAVLSKDNVTHDYILVPLGNGQIDIYDSTGTAAFYDIYEVTNTTLYFGHGFRDNYPSNITHGSTPEERINSLNTFIAYKKQ